MGQPLQPFSKIVSFMVQLALSKPHLSRQGLMQGMSRHSTSLQIPFLLTFPFFPKHVNPAGQGDFLLHGFPSALFLHLA
jgi:hypothetical protein